jgi:hypothetical protein
MRTTIDLDPQVLLVLKEKAAREKTTLGRVIDQLVRESRATYPAETRNGVPLLPNRKPGSVVTVEQIRDLRDEED